MLEISGATSVTLRAMKNIAIMNKTPFFFIFPPLRSLLPNESVLQQDHLLS